MGKNLAEKMRASGTAQERQQASARFRDGASPVLPVRLRPRSPRLSQAGNIYIHNATSREPYAAPELRPYDGRPGSLDFLACPSRTGQTLHYRSPQCIQFQRSEPLA